MRYLPGSDLNIYCDERLRERRLLKIANGLVWVCVAAGLVMVYLSVVVMYQGGQP
jgi:hypothetical protein